MSENAMVHHSKQPWVSRQNLDASGGVRGDVMQISNWGKARWTAYWGGQQCIDVWLVIVETFTEKLNISQLFVHFIIYQLILVPTYSAYSKSSYMAFSHRKFFCIVTNCLMSLRSWSFQLISLSSVLDTQYFVFLLIQMSTIGSVESLEILFAK